MVLDFPPPRLERRTKRQAIVLLPPPPLPFSAAVREAALADLIGAAVAVDGATILLVSGSVAPPFDGSGSSPAGIDLLDLSLDDPRGIAAAAVESTLRRAFERVVLVAGDAIGLSSRIIGTALGGLQTARAVVGATANNRIACLALGEAETALMLDGAGWLAPLVIGGPLPPPPSLPGPLRFVERRARVCECATPVDLRSAVLLDSQASIKLSRVANSL